MHTAVLILAGDREHVSKPTKEWNEMNKLIQYQKNASR